jgi:Ca2+-binding EF-hand superfamily protein
MASRDLNEDEIADLKEAFSMFDINGDGKRRTQQRNETKQTSKQGVMMAIFRSGFF